MNTKCFFVCLLALNFAAVHVAQATTYYISPSGNDNALGTSSSTAWQHLSKISKKTFNSGDSILLEGGKTHYADGWFSYSGRNVRAAIGLDSSDHGNITIASYGSGRATINAGPGFGIILYNIGNVTIKDLNIYGGTGNAGSGILFRNQSSASLGSLNISNVEIKNFRANVSNGDIGPDQGRGIFVRVASNTGYLSQFTLQNSDIHDCSMDGVITESNYPLRRIGNVRIIHNKIHHNPGIYAYTRGHSGSGVIVGGANAALVERNVAYENGSQNSHVGGPEGIWAWNSDKVIFQFNESHHNHSRSGSDGAGFDFDGSVTNSIMQYNYAHDNDGAGFIGAEFATSKGHWKNNTYRFNVSHNNGRYTLSGRTYYQGEFNLWTNSGSDMQNLQVYGNTILANNTNALRIKGGFTGSNIVFRNNLFLRLGSYSLMNLATTQGVSFSHNAYGPEYPGGVYDSSPVKLASTGDAGLTSLVAPQTLNDAYRLGDLAAYHLTSQSDLLDRGLNLQALGVATGSKDFYGHALPSSSTPYDVGAAQEGSSNYVAPPPPSSAPSLARIDILSSINGSVIASNVAGKSLEIDVSKYPNFDLRAYPNTSPTVESIKFVSDNSVKTVLENLPTYDMGADKFGSGRTGTFHLTVTPYTKDLAQGTAGTSQTLTLVLKKTSSTVTTLGDRKNGIHPVRDSSKCVDVPAWSHTNGTKLQLWSCGNAQANQVFHYIAATHEIRVYNDTKCVDLPGSIAANGSRVQIWDCHGGKNQKWTLTSTGQIKSDVNSSYCLDLSAGNTANGAKIQIWSCGSTNLNQKWTF